MLTTIYAPLRLATASQVEQAFASASHHQRLAAGGLFDPDSKDNFFFTCDLVHEGRNGNGDVFLREEMEASWHTLVGQPIDKDHDLHVDGIVGQLTDASYTVIKGTGQIRIAAYINQYFYPDVAWKLATGLVTGVSMECAFEYGDQKMDRRILHGVRFVGAGLTRMPADDDAHVDQMGMEALTVSSRRRSLLLRVAMEIAASRMAA